MSTSGAVFLLFVALILATMTTSNRKATITDEHREEARALKAIWDKQKPTSQKEFAKEFGIGSQAAVSGFLAGTSALSMKAAIGFATGLDCRIEEFSPRLAASAAQIAELADSDRGNTSNISSGPTARGPYPLISEVQAGEWTELCDHFAPGDAEDWLPSTRNLGHCGYMLRVTGKSMENPGGRHSFMEGVILHVNPDLDPMPGQFVIVRREATREATFKRYTLIDGDAYLEAINPEWPKDKKYLKLQPGDAWCGVVVDASFGNLP